MIMGDAVKEKQISFYQENSRGTHWIFSRIHLYVDTAICTAHHTCARMSSTSMYLKNYLIILLKNGMVLYGFLFGRFVK